MSLLAATASSGDILVWLGGAVSVSILIAAVIKIGRWISSVEDRLGRHDQALRRIGKALASTDERPEERGS